MRRRSVVVVALALVIVLVIGAGCGSGADGNGNTAVTSKAGFVEEVAATCTEVLAPIEEEYNSYVSESGVAEAEASGRLPRAQRQKMHEILDSATRAQLEVIGEFDPPKGDEDRIAAILVSLERAMKESEEDPGIAALETPAYDKAWALAHAYGLAGCHLG